jgi:hypothetical protein
VPHRLRLDRVTPAYAVAIWASALALRALVSVMVALLVVLLVPHSPALDAFSHWCWDAVVPAVGLHVELNGHHVGDAATLLPTLIVGGSLFAVAVGVARALRAIRQLVARHALGAGPRESVILGGSDVVLASAGLARPRVLVSAGALVALDDDELEAGLAHEHGHIARRHRFALLFGELCRGLGRFLPGTRSACAELVFHLERDADRWALAQRHEPLALAGAITKAKGAFAAGTGYAALDGSRVVERVAQLVERPIESTGTPVGIRLVAVAMVTLALGLFAWAPATAAAGLAELARDHPAHHCDDRH